MVCIEIRERERAKPPTPSIWCPLINLQHFCYIGIVQNKLELSEMEKEMGGGDLLAMKKKR